MMRFRLRALLVVLALLALMASGVRPAAMAEEKGLNGRWKVVIAMQGGKPIRDAVGHFAILSDDRYVQEDDKGKVTGTGAIKIDPSSAPQMIDVVADCGGSNLGVYELNGDSLEICWGYAKRPKSLDSSKDKTFVHFLFARVPNK
jgi:uncharacterized protein (TIGR03067 family)